MTGSASDPLDWQPHPQQARRRRSPSASAIGDCCRSRWCAIWLTGSTRRLPHDLRGQADARAWPHAGDCAGHNSSATSQVGWWSTTSGSRMSCQAALATHTERRHRPTAIDQREAVAYAREAKSAARCSPRLSRSWTTGSPAARLGLLPRRRHILAQEDGKNRLLRAVHDCRRRSRSPCQMPKRSAFEMMLRSSRRCAHPSRSVRPVRRSRTRN